MMGNYHVRCGAGEKPEVLAPEAYLSLFSLPDDFDKILSVIGYFEQELAWADIEKTPIQIVSDAYPSLTIKDVRKRLAGCGISSKHAMQEIGTLSGGEQAKVKMCLLIMKPCNFLIMDEPTNHLDALAKESLKTALEEFEGTVLLVSHEEAFYREWTQKVIDIEKKI